MEFTMEFTPHRSEETADQQLDIYRPITAPLRRYNLQESRVPGMRGLNRRIAGQCQDPTSSKPR